MFKGNVELQKCSFKRLLIVSCSVWVQNANGEKERAIDGKLEDYNLRAKKVDPSKLGVDTVKQYSGYLDDEKNDKHLFYCMVFRFPSYSVRG